jgi:hypothetical protein
MDEMPDAAVDHLLISVESDGDVVVVDFGLILYPFNWTELF